MSSDIFNVKGSTNIDPWGIYSGKSIREGFNSFVDKHPNWLVYVRRDVRFPHTCYDPTTKSPDTDCVECFGLGFSVQYEKHATRRVILAKEAESPIHQFGYLGQFRTLIYTPRYYYPKSKDLYLEVEWDTSLDRIETYGKPINIINIYQVDEATAFREDEVSYMVAKCDSYNFSLDTINEWLKALGNVWTFKKVI